MIEQIASFGPQSHLSAEGIFRVDSQVLIGGNAHAAAVLAAGLNGGAHLDAATPLVEEVALGMERSRNKHILSNFGLQVRLRRISVAGHGLNVPMLGIPGQFAFHVGRAQRPHIHHGRNKDRVVVIAPAVGVIHPLVASLDVVGESASNTAPQASGHVKAGYNHVPMPLKGAQVQVVFLQAVVAGDAVSAGGRCLQHGGIRNAEGKVHVRENEAGLIGIDIFFRAIDIGELHAQIQVPAALVEGIMRSSLKLGAHCTGVSPREGNRFCPHDHAEGRTAETHAQRDIRNRVELRLVPVSQIRQAGAQIVQELGPGRVLKAQLPLAPVSDIGLGSRGPYQVAVEVGSQDIPVLQIGRQLAALEGIVEVCPGGGAGAYSAIGLLGAVKVEELLLLRYVAVIAHVGVVRGVQIHSEVVSPHGVPHQLQLRMHGVTGAGLQIELMLVGETGGRAHLHQVGIKFVGAFVGRALDAVVKVQVKLEHRIRQRKQLRGLLNAGGLPGVHIGHLHHRIQILGA